MAKTLLSGNILQCDDLTDEDSTDCIMEVILREIVNTQNHQIQKMLAYLESNNIPSTDNCVVEIETVSMPSETGSPVASPAEPPAESPVSLFSGSSDSKVRITTSVFAVVVGFLPF